MTKIKNTKYSLLSAIIITLSLLGCSTSLGNLPSDYILTPDKGVVVLSLTSSGECGYAIYVDIRSVDEKYQQTIGLQEVLEERDWQRKNPDCSGDQKDYYGKLAVIDLPPGTYEIYQVSGIGRYGGFYSEEDFTIVFNVEGNQVSYVGNAHFHIADKSYAFDTFDMSERDLLLLSQKYPRLARNVSTNILQAYGD